MSRHAPFPSLVLCTLLALALPELGLNRTATQEVCPAGRRQVPALEITALLEQGRPVFLECAAVTGDLRLTPSLGPLPPIVLIDSSIDGNFEAPFARFGSVLRLDGTTIAQNVLLRAAVFEDEVNWSGAVFEGEVFDARSVRFRAPADLRATYRSVDFSDASFEGRALFQGSRFGSLSNRGDAAFFNVLFGGEASFRGASFFGEADFEGVTALGTMDLGHSQFLGSASFRALAAKDALILADSRFHCDVTLDRVAVDILDLSRANVDVQLTGCDESINAATLSIRSLRMDLSLVDRVPRTQGASLLQLIEKSARDRGEIDVANEALFKRESLATRDTNQPERAVRYSVELVTGYLVRPIRLILASLVVVAVAFLVRVVAKNWVLLMASIQRLRAKVFTPSRAALAADGPRGERGVRRRRSARVLLTFVQSLAEASLVAIDPRPPNSERTRFNQEEPNTYPRAGLVWVEYLVQKVLLVLFLVSLGNANPTLREIITSIR